MHVVAALVNVLHCDKLLVQTAGRLNGVLLLADLLRIAGVSTAWHVAQSPHMHPPLPTHLQDDFCVGVADGKRGAELVCVAHAKLQLMVSHHQDAETATREHMSNESTGKGG